MSIAPPDSTVAAIRRKIRRLTASSSEGELKTTDIDQYIQTVINQDFPYAIKLDQMRSVYTFYTRPYIDRYPLDVNFNQGIRSPMYVDGIQGYFFKDRDQYYRMWPRWPTTFQPISGDGVTQTFTFQIPGPFLSTQVTLGGVDVSGSAISVSDDGNGNLLLQVPNPVVSVPNYPAVPPTPTPVPNIPPPGMINKNTQNPGLNTQTYIGTVNYVTGVFAIDFSLGGVTPAQGNVMKLRVSQYQTGRPYSLLFWNNEFTIRPIPKQIHRVEIETYLTPTQFLESTDHPILNQWWQYIAVSAAIKVLEDRNDTEGVQSLMPLFQKQEALVLERQAVEEIGQRNVTIFSDSQQALGWNNGWMQGWM